MANLKDREVLQFRTHIDPMIPPKPRNAFSKKELTNWKFEMTPAGIYVEAHYQTPGNPEQIEEHIVPFSNVQSIKLAPVAAKA